MKTSYSRAGVRTLACLAVAASSGLPGRAVAQSRVVAAATPHVFALRPEALIAAKKSLGAHSPLLRPAFEKLLKDANAALTTPMVAVTDKHTLLPPSGDKHDYFSLSPYWWPDSTKADGLPYIRRDGVTNPESKKDLDQPRIAAMGANVNTLALAWYFTGDEKYAARSAAQLRRWFLDADTRMNPHLRFSQLVRGNNAERGSGIVDTRWFIEVVDAAGLLHGSKSWTESDDAALRKWFASYLTWLLTSPNGEHEQAAKNNHGSWFAAQSASYALYTGDSALARKIIEGAKARIGWQITSDGSQPIELERTRSMHYSGFNVEALSRLAEMGRHVRVDLWSYQAPEGGSLQRAVRHLGEYLGTSDKWPGPQIDAVPLDLMLIDLRRERTALNDPEIPAVLKRLPANVVLSDRSALLYPDQ